MAKGKKKEEDLSKEDVAGIDKIKNAPPLKSRPLADQRNLVAEKAFEDSLGDDTAALDDTSFVGEGLDDIEKARIDRAYARGAARNLQAGMRERGIIGE